MKQKLIVLSLLAAALVLTMGPSVANAQIADVVVSPDRVDWIPIAEVYDNLALTVTGPQAFCFIQTYDRGQVATLSIVDEKGERIPDGVYRWELTLAPTLSPALRKLMAEVRKQSDQKVQDEFLLNLPAPQLDTGYVTVLEGVFTDPREQEEGAKSLARRSAETGLSESRPGIAPRDFVILDDLIVDGSACIGFDCVNGESFGFDTVRLKENNLRIKFDDTSTAAAFPRNDWQLTANDSANGGASKFSIDDISGGRTPFTVEANAPSHSLYVDDGGRVGLGTSTPSVELHIIDGDTPALRLQQDGSSGFAPQTWDVAGNETNFFIRDVTNGSTLPFRIRPGAPSSSIFIDVDGDVGLNDSSPDDFLDVEISGASGGVTISSAVDGTLPRLTLIEPTRTWRFQVSNNGAFNFVDAGTGNTPFLIAVGADNGLLAIGADNAFSPVANRVTVNGQLFVGATQLNVPDYVFEPDYPLMPLAELRGFIAKNGHLPKVESAGEVEKQGGINLAQMPLTLLEKVEELTLYTLAQQDHIDRLSQEVAGKDAAISELVERLAKLERRLDETP